MCVLWICLLLLVVHLLVASVYLAATGLGTLRQLSKSKVQYVSTLGMVIPYLELSAKQEYLVQRIKGDLWIVCVSHVMY